MKLNTTDFLQKLQHPLVMALAVFPLVIFLLAQHAPEAQDMMWVLPTAYVLLAWVCLVLPGKLRLIAGLASLAGMVAITLAAWPVAAHAVLVLVVVVYAVLMILTLPIGGWERGRELNLAWYVIGLISHGLVQLLINGAQRLGNTAFDNSEGVLVGSFLALAVLLVLAMNRTSLKSASQSRRSIPLLMRRQNLVLTLAALVIGVLISLIPALGQALAWAWDKIVQLLLVIGAFLASFMANKPAGGGTPGGGAGDSMSLGPASEPSQLALLMEKIIGYVALVVVVVGLVFFLRMLFKRLVKLLRYLWARLSSYSAAVGEDYEDEITSTREEDVERESLLGRLRRFALGDEKGLDATQRVRSRYRYLKRRRPGWSPASTARETLPEEAACLYERARYAGETLTDEEAERFRNATKKI